MLFMKTHKNIIYTYTHTHQYMTSAKSSKKTIHAHAQKYYTATCKMIETRSDGVQ